MVAQITPSYVSVEADANKYKYRFLVFPAQFVCVEVRQARNDGIWPLFYAAEVGHATVVEKLLNHGAVVDKARHTVHDYKFSLQQQSSPNGVQ